jgi:hypothetical protein
MVRLKIKSLIIDPTENFKNSSLIWSVNNIRNWEQKVAFLFFVQFNNI